MKTSKKSSKKKENKTLKKENKTSKKENKTSKKENKTSKKENKILKEVKVKAKSKYLKISPKKVRLVTKLIQGMNAEEALSYLDFIPKRGSYYIKKTLKSAISNAQHNFDLKKDNLFIKEIFVNEGATLKRWRPRAFGRAGQIRKKSSHIEIILDEKISSGKVKSAKKEKLKEPEIKALSDAEEVVAEDKKDLEKGGTKPTSEPGIKKPSKPKGKKIFRDIFRRKSI